MASPTASSIAQRDLDGAFARSQSSRVDSKSTQAKLDGSQTSGLLAALATPCSVASAPQPVHSPFVAEPPKIANLPAFALPDPMMSPFAEADAAAHAA
eukprot:8853225-Karenia_brevis.AAC.1